MRADKHRKSSELELPSSDVPEKLYELCSKKESFMGSISVQPVGSCLPSFHQNFSEKFQPRPKALMFSKKKSRDRQCAHVFKEEVHILMTVFLPFFAVMSFEVANFEIFCFQKGNVLLT